MKLSSPSADLFLTAYIPSLVPRVDADVDVDGNKSQEDHADADSEKLKHNPTAINNCFLG